MFDSMVLTTLAFPTLPFMDLACNLRSVMPGHMGAIHTVKCSPCGRYIASAGGDLAVLVWDVASGRVCRVFRGHKKPVHSVDFSSCGRFLASASADGTCHATPECCTQTLLLPGCSDHRNIEFFLPYAAVHRDLLALTLPLNGLQGR